jgi:signal transduction histidine kinase
VRDDGDRMWWWWPVSVAAALAILVVAAFAADAQIDRRRATTERRDGEAVAGVAVGLVDAAASALRSLRLDGGSVALDPALAEQGAVGASAVAVVGPAAGGTELVVEAGAIDPAAVASPAVISAAGTARDDGRALLSAPVPEVGAPVLVVPIYDVDGDRSTELPSVPTAQRRVAWAGAVLLQLDVDRLLDPDATPVRVSDGEVVLGGGEVGDDAVGLTVPVAARQWRVEVPAGTAGTPTSAVLLLLLGVVAAGGVLWLQRSALAVSQGAARQAEARSRQAGTIRRVAPVLQQSTDLGDVLPAVAVLLQEELDVDGFALAAYGGDGALQELFSSGRPVDPVAVSGTDVTELAAGDTLALPLRRAERDIALLRIRSSRRLEPLEVESVRSAAELLAAALISAQAFERQEAAMVALRQVDELKNVFLGVASHELRTPVTAIGGFARLLADRWDQLPEDQRRNLASRIEANAASLGVLVQDLLDFSRLERGRFVIDSEEVDLAARLEAVVDRLGPIWGGRPVDLVIDERPIVEGDGDALERVAANLLSNAAKFSPEGSAIVASIAVDDGTAVFRVDDAGPGVPEEERAHIYAAFFRGTGDAVVRTRGAGIGLSVVKEIVEQMGGTISVGTSPAGGARFEVRLPLQRPEVLSEEVAG